LTAELFLSPIPDLVPPLEPNKRRGGYTAFNKFFVKSCFSEHVETTTRSPEGYLSERPADPSRRRRANGIQRGEYTVWLGFVPHLLLLICVGSTFSKVARCGLPGRWGVLLAHDPVHNRFIPTRPVYRGFWLYWPCAAFGPSWDFRPELLLPGLGRIVAKFAIHILLDANLLAFGGPRNLQFVWHRTAAPEMHSAAPGVIEAIRTARRIYIPYTHWKALCWNFMRFSPAARYSTGVDLRLPSPGTMVLLSIAPEGGVDLVPAKLPPGSTAGLTYLGNADSQPIFAQGGGARNLGKKEPSVYPASRTD
jgi:hypothetical protein